MTSKKVQLSFELTTEKEWREFIQQPGLLVVDLYRDWAGPCVAMSTPLKNLKVSDQAYNWVHLASAPASIVPDLKRLEGSRPTFVLLSEKRLVNVIFGCNAPEVVRMIMEEVEREKRSAQGLEKRRTVSLTKLSPAEVEIQQRLLNSESDRLRTEQFLAKMEAESVQRRILGQIAESLPNVTVVVVFPFALQFEACEGILDELRRSWAEMGIKVAREEQIELEPDVVDLMFWERRLPQHDVLVDSVTQGASLVLMLEHQQQDEKEIVDEEEEEAEFVLDMEATVARSIYGFLPGTGSSMELITPADESETPELLEEALGVEEEDGGWEEGAVETGSPEEVEADDRTDKAEEMVTGATEGEVAAESQVEKGKEVWEGKEEGDERVGEEEAVGEEETAGEEEASGEEEAAGEEEEVGEEEAARGEEKVDPKDYEDEEGADEDDERGRAPDEEEDLIPQAPVRVWNPRELLPAVDSAAARLLCRRDDQGPVLAGIWTPLTALSKAAAVKGLFEDVAEPLYQPPTPPPPPPPESTVICFAGDKRDEVLVLTENFPSEVSRIGFFTKSRKLLATSRGDYERLVRDGLQSAKTLVVMEVMRTRSAPLLELATAGPLYISATPALAKADVEEFFGSRVVLATRDDLRDIIKGRELEGDDVPHLRPEDELVVAETSEGADQQEGLGRAESRNVQEAQPDAVAEVGLGDGEGQEGIEDYAELEAVAVEHLLSRVGEGDVPDGGADTTAEE